MKRVALGACLFASCLLAALGALTLLHGAGVTHGHERETVYALIPIAAALLVASVATTQRGVARGATGALAAVGTLVFGAALFWLALHGLSEAVARFDGSDATGGAALATLGLTGVIAAVCGARALSRARA